MNLFSPFKNVVTRTFNFKRWLLADNLKENAQFIRSAYSKVFKRTQNTTATNNKDRTHFSDFEACMKHHGLSEAELNRRIKNSWIVTRIFLAIAVGMLLYSGYLFYQSIYLGGFVTIVLAFLLLAYAFQEHMRYFQMKQRKLKISLQEVFHFTFRSGR